MFKCSKVQSTFLHQAMLLKLVVLCLCASLVLCETCYWNEASTYRLFGSKTPYDVVRGDIRDYPTSQDCIAVSLWSLHRHGNRFPGPRVTRTMLNIIPIKDEIINSFYQGKGEMCAQDIENLKRWQWNGTIEIFPSFLTSQGYHEHYSIGKRLAEKYPQLQDGGVHDYTIKTSKHHRTVVSARAFVRGLLESSNRTFMDGPEHKDSVMRPYQNCERYQKEIRNGVDLIEEIKDYFTSQEFISVRENVQRRLGIDTRLSDDQIFSIYEVCRYLRSWEQSLRDPWCSVFRNQDLMILEYYDDVRHYYKNGYGSWVNIKLGAIVVKDLYQHILDFIRGKKKKVVAYFTHDTTVGMALCAMGLFKDDYELHGRARVTNRMWRTSHIGCFSANIIVVLNKCIDSGNLTYRIQLFVNEKVTKLCPYDGCTWERFQEYFGHFADADMKFCSSNYFPEELMPLQDDNYINIAVTNKLGSCVLGTMLVAKCWIYLK